MIVLNVLTCDTVTVTKLYTLVIPYIKDINSLFSYQVYIYFFSFSGFCISLIFAAHNYTGFRQYTYMHEIIYSSESYIIIKGPIIHILINVVL